MLQYSDHAAFVIMNAYFDGEEIVQQISSLPHLQTEPTVCKSTDYKYLIIHVHNVTQLLSIHTRMIACPS